jgi:hypothetical protein
MRLEALHVACVHASKHTVYSKGLFKANAVNEENHGGGGGGGVKILMLKF